jgi:hypothetical protein
LVVHRRQWRRLAQPPLNSADLVGWCFNCLYQDHVEADCPNATRCLRCHREGHNAHTCKRPRSPDAAGPPPKRPSVVVVLQLRPREIFLGRQPP